MPRLILLFFFSAAVTWVLSRLLLRGHNSGAIIKDELLATQKEKEGTPVVGGIAFGLSTLVVGLFDSALSDPIIFIPLVTMLIFGLIGFADDRAKAHSASSDRKSVV